MTNALSEDHRLILRALARAEATSLPLEEIAPTARITFEQAWYAALDLIQLRLLSPNGVGFYSLTRTGKEAARRL
jgi:hypothetical protein